MRYIHNELTFDYMTHCASAMATRNMEWDFSFGKKTFRPKVYVYTVSGRQIGCLTTFPTQFKEMVLSI